MFASDSDEVAHQTQNAAKGGKWRCFCVKKIIYIYIKVKFSRYRPGVAQRG